MFSLCSVSEAFIRHIRPGIEKPGSIPASLIQLADISMERRMFQALVCQGTDWVIVLSWIITHAAQHLSTMLIQPQVKNGVKLAICSFACLFWSLDFIKQNTQTNVSELKCWRPAILSLHLHLQPFQLSLNDDRHSTGCPGSPRFWTLVSHYIPQRPKSVCVLVPVGGGMSWQPCIEGDMVERMTDYLLEDKPVSVFNKHCEHTRHGTGVKPGILNSESSFKIL